MRALTFQRLLGSGAVGSVYLAELSADRGFRRQVAVKVLQKDHPNGEMFMSRVRDEARLLGLLADDHILKVLELTKVEGRDAVVMEFVEGVDLEAIVEAGQRPPPRALAELGAAVAGALHRAHRAVHPSSGAPLNVIHRDVKPANVMVTSRGGVKLLDFGVARARFEARESHTGQFVLGTLNYMAPEYIVTGEVSPAADIYGLALTLWEAACGEVFGQPKLREDLHAARIAERLDAIAATHGELLPVLRAMLAWDPRARPTGDVVERAFIEASDALRGTGLRAWAAGAVPGVLAREREAARDDVGLLGRTVPIGEADALPTGDSRVGPLPAPPPSPFHSGDRPRPAAPAPAPPPSPFHSGDRPRPAAPAPFHSGDRPRPAAPAPAPAPAPGGDREASEATVHRAPRPSFLDAPTTPPTAEPPLPVAPPPPPPRRAPARPAPSAGLLIVQGLLIGGVLGFAILVALGAFLLYRGLP